MPLLFFRSLERRWPRISAETRSRSLIIRCKKQQKQQAVNTSAPSHSHDSSGNDAPSLISNPATPAKAGAHCKRGSRPSPGKRGGDVELHQLNESVH